MGVLCGGRSEVGGLGAPGASGAGPGLVGRRSGRLTRAGHAPELVLAWEGWLGGA